MSSRDTQHRVSAYTHAQQCNRLENNCKGVGNVDWATHQQACGGNALGDGLGVKWAREGDG